MNVGLRPAAALVHGSCHAKLARRGPAMLDVKELFRHERWKQLHDAGLPAQAPNGLRRGALWPEASIQDARGTPTWQCFPDPAVLSLLQNQAERARELLAACGSSLQLCVRGAEDNRRLLRTCRTQLEDHQASSTAVRDLLGGGVCFTPEDPENFWAAEAAIVNNSADRLAPLARPKICVGRVRCYFCRERRALEEAVGTLWLPCEGPFEGDDWALESAVLADASSCCDSSAIADELRSMHGQRAGSDNSPDPNDGPAGTESPRKQKVQRRRTSRERGQPVFKAQTQSRSMLDEKKNSERTWYAMHTMDPSAEQAKHQGASKPHVSEDQGSGASAIAPPMTVPAASSPKSPTSFSVHQPGKQLQSAAATWGKPPSSAPSAVPDTTPFGITTPQRVKTTTSAAACAADAAELEPYTSAAARFREEMEFLDLSSHPGSPAAEHFSSFADQRGGFGERRSAAASPVRRGRAWSWEPSSQAAATFQDFPPPPPPAPLPGAATMILDASSRQGSAVPPPPPTTTMPPTQTWVLKDGLKRGSASFAPPPPMPLSKTRTGRSHPPPPPPKDTGPPVATLQLDSREAQPASLFFRWKLLLRRVRAKLVSDPAMRFLVFQRWVVMTRQKRLGGTKTMAMGVVHQPLCPPSKGSSSRRPSKPASPMPLKP